MDQIIQPVVDLVQSYPKGAATLVIVTGVQVVAPLIARIPELWGVKHETVWSRLWRGFAALPIRYTPKV